VSSISEFGEVAPLVTAPDISFAVERLVEALLLVADATGDARILHAARVINAPASPGRTPIDDADALGEIVEMMGRDVRQSVAIAKVARQVGAGAKATHRWRRKLRERKKVGQNRI
jgi:hypothetical protein